MNFWVSTPPRAVETVDTPDALEANGAALVAEDAAATGAGATGDTGEAFEYTRIPNVRGHSRSAAKDNT